MTIDIRVAQSLDASGVLAIYAPYCENSTVTFETAVPALEEMVDRITRVSESYPWLVAELDGRILGYAYATRFRERAAYRWTAEVAIYVEPNQQQRGLGAALYAGLFAILRIQGYSKLIAGITLPNPASVRLHEKLGFQKVGHFPNVGYKAGLWLDVGWWQLLLANELDEPQEPKPFPSVLGEDGIPAALEKARRLANKGV